MKNTQPPDEIHIYSTEKINKYKYFYLYEDSEKKRFQHFGPSCVQCRYTKCKQRKMYFTKQNKISYVRM